MAAEKADKDTEFEESEFEISYMINTFFLHNFHVNLSQQHSDVIRLTGSDASNQTSRAYKVNTLWALSNTSSKHLLLSNVSSTPERYSENGRH